MYSLKLQSLLSEIEFVINCWPITFLSNDANNAQPLKPINFISPNVNINLLVPLLSISVCPVSNQEKLLALLQSTKLRLDKFWNKWSVDYLLSLRKRVSKISNQKRKM